MLKPGQSYPMTATLIRPIDKHEHLKSNEIAPLRSRPGGTQLTIFSVITPCPLFIRNLTNLDFVFRSTPKKSHHLLIRTLNLSLITRKPISNLTSIMDFLKKAQGMMGGSKTHNQQPAGQGDDYVDKGLAAIQKKLGMSSNRQTNEKITDAGRSFYEKQTGSKVNPKVCFCLFVTPTWNYSTDSGTVQQLIRQDLSMDGFESFC